jgi:hypothetical protein
MHFQRVAGRRMFESSSHTHDLGGDEEGIFFSITVMCFKPKTRWPVKPFQGPINVVRPKTILGVAALVGKRAFRTVKAFITG